MLASRSGYSSIVVDHILPKGHYPQLAEEPNNHALACSSCNTMKGAYDPMTDSERNFHAELCDDKRKKLIELVREHLQVKIADREREWKRIRNAFNS